jgi:hypothetical protein
MTLLGVGARKGLFFLICIILAGDYPFGIGPKSAEDVHTLAGRNDT